MILAAYAMAFTLTGFLLGVWMFDGLSAAACVFACAAVAGWLCVAVVETRRRALEQRALREERNRIVRNHYVSGGDAASFADFFGVGFRGNGTLH